MLKAFRVSDIVHHSLRGESGRRKDDGQCAVGRRDDLQRHGEPALHRPHQRLEIGIARHVAPNVLVVHHQHVVARNARDVRGHRDAGGAILTARTRGIADGGIRDLPLYGDVHLTVGPGQPLHEQAAHANQVIERGVGGAVEEGGNRRELRRGRKRELHDFAELRRCARAANQLGWLRLRGGGARHAHATAREHAQVHARLLGDAGRLEPARFERDRGLLFAPPQRVGPIDLAACCLQHAIDHTSPPISASSMRTCGAPSVTGSGNWPPLPQPPPI